ncbi:hypothetical protein ABD76_10500 [Paenibacillus dendritiformis]|uniref:condensation domain-containing protein n=1 Tax=Paenibacillus dendritiformis TaxID=130049 RepID=UPI0018CD6C20|nr:condensation domain-containing protein [Paenibacillus dendritiformis]MBG9792896.1 hypothetical protein [Paenibacillus dendritiformis]
MAYTDIAIIGLSLKLPLAESLEELDTLLGSGTDAVRNLPDSRRRLSGLESSKVYMQLGYLDEIEYFDHAFFNISLHEAIHMDPQQRIALQLACECIENAGYSLSQLRGSRTSVIMSLADNKYRSLLPGSSGVAFVGTLGAAAAGKISYYLDLRGPAVVVDTSCSSSLTAIHQACVNLGAHEADMALAGGVSIMLDVPAVEEMAADPLGIASPRGRSRAFDAEADGAGAGEGGGFVLLKRLEDAVRDHDPIYAVIKGSALNHDGGRSNSLAAPSPQAQTEVITDAWQKSGIPPETITYIEAHGTGTKIGDPIEAQGLDHAFKAYTNRARFCALGTIKTNMGHLGSSAGIAGLLKAVLSIRQRKLYPLLHYRKANPLISFENSAVYPNRELQQWNESPRRAGVSSFGLSGTNVHVVIEEPGELAEPTGPDPVEETEYIIKLSAMTESSFRHTAAKILEAVRSRPSLAIRDVACTLNAGRDNYLYRTAFVAASVDQLKSQLEASLHWKLTPGRSHQVVLLCSGDIDIPDAAVERLRDRYPAFDAQWNDCCKASPLDHAASRTVAFQYSLFRCWTALGVQPKQVVGTGWGNWAVEIITGKTSLAEGLEQAKLAAMQPPFNEQGFAKAIRTMIGNDNVVFVELGVNGKLSRIIAEQYPYCKVLGSWDERISMLGVLRALYEHHVDMDWAAHARCYPGRRIHLPGYGFDRIKCWPEISRPDPERNPNKPLNPIERHQEQTTKHWFNGTAAESLLASVWSEVLESRSFGRDDDFFDLGGNSLMGMQIILRVKDKAGVELDFDHLYEYPTLRQLAAFIDRLGRESDASAAEETTEPRHVPDLGPVQRDELMPLSHEQMRMMTIYQHDPDSASYNMPAAIELKGELDARALEEALCRIVMRHEILRTIYCNHEGGVYQQVMPADRFTFEIQEVGGLRPDLLEREIGQYASEPFKLFEDLSFRAKLLRCEPDVSILLLNIHHIAADGWSIHILIKELIIIYCALLLGEEPALEDLPCSYADYAYWQAQTAALEPVHERLDFWIRHLQDAPQRLLFPTDYPRPDVLTNRGDIYLFTVGKELTSRAKAWCREQDATLFMFLFSIYNLLVFRYTNQNDICIGVPVANRIHRHTEPLIGFFANTLALRTQLHGQDTFLDLLKRVKHTVTDAFKHQDVPFHHVVEAVAPERNAACTPLFQHAFALQNAGRNALMLPNLSVRFLETASKAAKFDMTLSFYEDAGELIGMIEYNRDLFRKETIERYAEHYCRLMSSACEAPHAKLMTLSMLSEEEQRIVLGAALSDEEYEF